MEPTSKRLASHNLFCLLIMFRVDNDLNSIKGGGACQLREKVLAEAAKTWIIVADYRKNSHVLGTTVSIPRSPRAREADLQWKQGIPIEVVPFAYAKVLHNLAELGSPSKMPDGKPGLTLRMGKMKAGPVVSDNGMFIIDAPFPEEQMKNPSDVSSTTLAGDISSRLAVGKDQNVDWCCRGRAFLRHGQSGVLWKRGGFAACVDEKRTDVSRTVQCKLDTRMEMLRRLIRSQITQSWR